MMSRSSSYRGLGESVFILILFSFQVALVGPLFDGEFTKFRGSIEAAFITDARFIAEHFPDLSWNPLWYLGFPFEWFYTPLVPAAVAVVGKLSGDIPHAYRAVSALGFALGPVALYLAARELTRSRWAASIAAIAFVILPSLSYVFTSVRDEATRVSGAIVPPPWRLIALVRYGEGPHVLSLTLTLFAVAAAIRYLREPRDRRLGLAVGLVVSVAFTNLIGVLGAALYFFGIGASRSSEIAARFRWTRLLRIGVYAGLLSLGWYSLGFIRAVLGFSPTAGEDGASLFVALPAVLLVVYIVGDLLGRRGPAGIDTVLMWLLTFGAIVTPWQLFQVAIAPQAKRYLLEFDAAFAIGIGIAIVWFGDQLLTRMRPANNRRFAVAVSAVLLFLAIGIPGWRAIRPVIEPDPGWQSWSERRVALWLREHLRPGERAYLTGSHAFWVDVFADVPQVQGGGDFASTHPWWARVTNQVNTGTDREISWLWFQALGVRYVVITDRTSPDVYAENIADPQKFDGLLPIVFQDRGVRIYEVSPVGDAVVALVRFGPDSRAPTNASDRAALKSYVADLEAGLPPNAITQSGLASWHIVIDAPTDVALVLRQAYDTGWRATMDGSPVPVRSDPIGQTTIAIPAGSHLVSLDHRVHRDLLVGLILSLSTGLWVIVRRIRGR